VGAADATYYAPGNPLANVVVGFLVGAIFGAAVLVRWTKITDQSRGQNKRRQMRIVPDRN
jgi:hypothetical protein